MRFLNDYWDDGRRAFFRRFGHATPGEDEAMTWLDTSVAMYH